MCGVFAAVMLMTMYVVQAGQGYTKVYVPTFFITYAHLPKSEGLSDVRLKCVMSVCLLHV